LRFFVSRNVNREEKKDERALVEAMVLVKMIKEKQSSNWPPETMTFQDSLCQLQGPHSGTKLIPRDRIVEKVCEHIENP